MSWQHVERRPKAPPAVVAGEPGLLVEVAGTDFAGEVVRVTLGEVVLRNRRGVERVFRNEPGGFWVGDEKATLAPPARVAPKQPRLTRSGSIATPAAPARVARASRIWVEGTHDAELLEHVWGEDLRWVGVVVEPIDGIDDLEAKVAAFSPGPTRRLGILVDHLVPGTKEERLCRPFLGGRHPDVLVLGHRFVDIWAAIDPARLGLDAWPTVPRDVEWKQGVIDAVGARVDLERLGVAEPWQFWKLLLSRVRDVKDVDRDLWRNVEQLIDFVTLPEADGDVADEEVGA